jgi:hypothetical protein
MLPAGLECVRTNSTIVIDNFIPSTTPVNRLNGNAATAPAAAGHGTGDRATECKAKLRASSKRLCAN